MVIYLTTNLINGKQYIGKDCNNNPNYIGSGTDLKKAIRKYGKKNFKKTIIEHCDNLIHLVERETYWLNFYDVENNMCFYNKTNKPFGNSGLSEETKKKISKSKKGVPLKHGNKISEGRIGIKHQIHTKGNKHKNFGKKRTKIQKKEMSLIRIGKKHSEEWKQSIKNNRKKCIEVKSRPVQQINKNNNQIIQKYKSITEARKLTGIKGIKNVVTNLAKTAGGFIWEYVN